MSQAKRSAKTTSRQYSTMVDFISNNKKMINSKLTPEFTSKKKEDLWSELTNLLNADGMGPVKSTAKWKKTWADFKSDVKIKVADNKRKMRKTGGGPPPDDLPELYEKTASIIGDILIAGDKDVEETGRKEKNDCEKNIFQVIDESEVLNDYNIEDKQYKIEDDNTNQLSYEEFGTPTENQLIKTPRYSSNQTPVRPVKNHHKKICSVPAPDMSDLIAEEAKKAEALKKIAAAIERSNEIRRERNEIEKERNEIEKERNVVLDSVAGTLTNLLEKFITK